MLRSDDNIVKQVDITRPHKNIASKEHQGPDLQKILGRT